MSGNTEPTPSSTQTLNTKRRRRTAKQKREHKQQQEEQKKLQFHPSDFVSDSDRCAIDDQLGMPSLYPGPPTWLEIPYFLSDAFGDVCSLPSLQAECDRYIQQRCMDVRNDKLNLLYQAWSKPILSPKAHTDLHRQAGFLIDPCTISHLHSSTRLSREEFAQIAFPGMRLQSPITPMLRARRLCEHCHSPCTYECECGTAYCYVECQREDWKAGHEQSCSLIQENYPAVMLIHRYFWTAMQEEAELAEEAAMKRK